MSINKAILLINNIAYDIVDISESGLTPELEEKGYKLFDDTSRFRQSANELELTDEDLSNYLMIIEVYDYDEANEIYTVRYDKVVCSQSVNAAIVNLKNRLADMDYMTIKNMQAQLAGSELPYSPTELLAECQPLRDEINRLEQLINTEL